ncbi:MAG: CoA transferase, partial [Pseudomonadota bacterium]
MSMQATILEGLKIVSMAEQFPGPFATMLLADMGAEVIIVERPGMGDPSRFLPPFFEALNRGKKSVALNVKEADDKAKFISLISEADIFLEGFRPGRLKKLGLGYDALSEINPKLIYASISGYGQTGPYRDRPGHDLSYQGVGGSLFEQLAKGDDAEPTNILLGDVGSAMFATVGVLAALEARRRTGRGSYIDVSMADSVASMMTAAIALAANGGANLPGPGAEPAYDLFQTSDQKWLTLSIAHEDNYWSRLCATLGLDDFKDLDRGKRIAIRSQLKSAISDVIRRQTFDEWDRTFTENDQMFGPAYDRADVLTDPQLMARGLFETLVRKDGGEQVV